MKKLFYIIPILAVVAIGIIKLRSNKKETQEKVYTYDKEQPILVTADTVRQQLLSGTIQFTGTFEPFREGKIMAEIPGKILRLNYDAGDFISTGAVVASLDASLLAIQVQSTQVQIDGYSQDVKRYEILLKADAIQGVQLEKAELALRSAKLQKQQLQEQISKATITAPFSGVVTQKLVEVGTVVGPGVPLLQLTDISRLKLTVNVPESAVQKFKEGNTLQVSVDVLPEKLFTGKVTMIGSKGDAAHNFPVQILITNPAGLPIKAGMYGLVNQATTNEKEVIIIPLKAIIGSSAQPQVYIIKNGKAVLQNITILKRTENKAIIESGLNEGDVIVTNGFINLFNGAKLSITN
jgi:RND family efflux transporter MFP subunit